MSSNASRQTAAPELGSRALLPDLSARAYLNHSAISPVCRPVQEAVSRVLADYAERGVLAYGSWAKQRSSLRHSLAQLIGAQPEELALTANTTAGVIDIALCFPWSRGDRVISFQGEFPANVTPWQRAAELFGLSFGLLPANEYLHDRGAALRRLAGELRQGVRLVAVSAVQFQTGLRMPMEEIGDLCRRHGAELFVDAIQGLGVMPVDVEAWQADYLSSGSHKYLMGMEGAGLLYVRPERVTRLRPHLAGWLSHEDAEAFLFRGPGHLRYDRPIRNRASLFEGGTCNVAGYAALAASVELLSGLGIAAIFDHVTAYVEALEPAVTELGFRSLRARDPALRSSFLAVAPPAGVSVLALRNALLQRGVVVGIPDGNVRFAPHWHNAPDEVPQVVEALKESLTEIRG